MGLGCGIETSLEREAIPLREGELGGDTCSPDTVLGSLPAKTPAVHCGWALVLASTSPGCGGGGRQQWQRVRLVAKELDSRLSPGPLVLSRGGGKLSSGLSLPFVKEEFISKGRGWAPPCRQPRESASQLGSRRRGS